MSDTDPTSGASAPDPFAPPPPPIPPGSGEWPQATPSPGPAPEPIPAGQSYYDERSRGERRGGGATAGIVLIVIGAIFLLGRLAPGFAWWSLWPLIVIFAGLVQAFTPGKDGYSANRVFDGLVTVAFGFVFLAITFGVVGWSVMWRILGFWPVLLIAVGFDLLGKALGRTWLRVLGSLAIIGALAFAVASSAGTVTPPTFPTLGAAASEPFSEAQPLGATTTAKLKLEAGVAQVRMGAADGSDLFTLTGSSPWGAPTWSVTDSGSDADVAIELGSGDNVSVWPGSPTTEADLRLSRSVLWDATIDTGVSSLDADFSALKLRSLDLKPGVADCSVRLGSIPAEVSVADVSVKAGVSSVTLRLPRDAEARIDADTGLSSNDIAERFERLSGSRWQTPGYDAARQAGKPVYDIVVKSGVGSVTIDTY